MPATDGGDGGSGDGDDGSSGSDDDGSSGSAEATSAPEATAAPAAPEPQYGGTLVFGLEAETTNGLNPVNCPGRCVRSDPVPGAVRDADR